MIFFEVLVEGTSDVPAIREVLCRRFGLREEEHFRIHKHHGKGKLPPDLKEKLNLKDRSLLNQLPSKLKGYGKSLLNFAWVLVVVDADNDNPKQLLHSLNQLAQSIKPCPKVIFRIAVEETESWFIADTQAVKKAYPTAKIALINKIQPDAVVGAWERLAECLQIDIKTMVHAGALKTTWAETISPHLDLQNPKSPSLKGLVDEIENYVPHEK